MHGFVGKKLLLLLFPEHRYVVSGGLLRCTLVYIYIWTPSATECVAQFRINLRHRRPLEDHVTVTQKHWRITRFVVTPWSPAFSKRANLISLPFSFCGPVETVRSTRTITPVLYGPVVVPVFARNTPKDRTMPCSHFHGFFRYNKASGIVYTHPD